MITLRSWFASLPLLVGRWKLAVLIWIADLLLAAIVLFPLSRAFASSFGQSTAGAATGAGEFLEWAWQDWHLTQAEPLAQSSATFSAVALVAFLFAFVITSAGTFALLAKPGTKSSLREFLAGAGTLAGPCLRLLPLFALGCVAVAWVNRGLSLFATQVVAETLDRGATSAITAAILHGKSLYALLLHGWLVAATGLAKARMARTGERSAWRCFFSAWATVLRRPFSSALLAALGPLMVAGSLAGYVALRRTLGAGPESELFGKSLPTLVLYLVATQSIALLLRGSAIVWAGSFLRFERSSQIRSTPTATTVTTVAVLIAGSAAPSAHAFQHDHLPLGPFPEEYALRVTLDPAHRTIAGHETVLFRNLSTKPVGELRFHLYANAFAQRDTPFLRERRRNLGSDPTAGLGDDAFGSCRVAGVKVAGRAATPTIDSTVMTLALPQPVAPGASVTIELDFTTRLAHFDLSGRGGFLGSHFDAMQWYPQLGVLRDGAIDCEPFHSDTEFFADFARYDVTIDAPKRFVVGATGDLMDELELPPAALGAETLVRRRFSAFAVHDFAWCADPNFERADATFDAGGRTVRVTYLCQPFAREKQRQVLDVATRCLERCGEWFFPYPYDSLTIDGLPMGGRGGMEYPTLFTISQGFPNHLPWLAEQTEEPAGVTAHEFGHQYWYGVLASDETHEAWLDEGINTYVTTKLEEELFHSRTSRALPAIEWRELYRPLLNEGVSVRAFGAEFGFVSLFGFETSPFRQVTRGQPSAATLLGFAIPNGIRPGFHLDRFLDRRDGYVRFATNGALTDPSCELYPGAYSALTYGKTALALRTLENVFGWDALRGALGEYARRFRFRHPSGADFLGVLREVIPQRCAGTQAAGSAIDPFLSGLFTSRGTIDFAVTQARSAPHPEGDAIAAGYDVAIVAENRGTLALPTAIRLDFADGSVAWEPYPAEQRFVTIERVTPSALVAATIDPDHRFAIDLDWSNNGRTVARNADVCRRFDAAALFWIESAFSFLRTLGGP